MKHWAPSKPTVALKPSRIRREPVQLQAVTKAQPASREHEIAGGVVGILLITAALVTAIVGISAVTLFKDDPGAAAEAVRFSQCYNAPGPNCVVDGDTISVAGERLTISGMDVPAIQGAQCDAERELGIDAAVRLAELLNGGRVSIGPTFADDYGQDVRSVMVNGKDVAKPMIEAGLARRPGADKKDWCAKPAE